MIQNTEGLSVNERDGSLIDTDKAVWIQGRAAWLLATIV